MLNSDLSIDSLLILSYLLEATLEPQPMFFKHKHKIFQPRFVVMPGLIWVSGVRAGMLTPDVGLRAYIST